MTSTPKTPSRLFDARRGQESSGRSPLILTKILATLGPATERAESVRHLVEQGATLFRLNFSHGKPQDHAHHLENIRQVSREMGVPLAVLADLPGPKIRTSMTPDEGIVVEPGQDVVIRPALDMAVAGDPAHLGCNYKELPSEVEPGHRVLINDGMIRMIAVERDDAHLVCRVTTGGRITSRKGINLPDSSLSVPSVTDRDWAAARWAVENRIDFLALSFVRQARDVQLLRRQLDTICTEEMCGTGLTTDDDSPSIPIIAKIETPQGVANIDEILEHCEGIMVARGDLGVEMDLAQVPVIQKRLVTKAHDHGRPCIVATQMLESMIDKATPTRAEVSDVANAILDGADAVMLSGETAVGRYPALAVEVMKHVAEQTELAMRDDAHEPRPPARLREQREKIPALAHGAWHMARDVGAVLVAVWSQRGGSARYLSRNGFRVPIIAFSTDERAVRRMALLYSVYPVHVREVPEHRSDFARLADDYILSHEIAERGDPIVLLGGKPLDRPGSTNTVAIRRVGELSDA